MVAGVLTLLALPASPAVASPAPPKSAVVTPLAEPVVSAPPSPLPQVGLGALQLVAGYAAGIGGTVGLAAVGLNPNQLDSEYAFLAFAGTVAPALTGAAVCGTGYLSSRYRGRCWTAILGAYSGAIAGVLLGVLLAPSPGPDDTAEFTNTMSAIVGGALLMPIGAVAGWHLGKQEIVEP